MFEIGRVGPWYGNYVWLRTGQGRTQCFELRGSSRFVRTRRVLAFWPNQEPCWSEPSQKWPEASRPVYSFLALLLGVPFDVARPSLGLSVYPYTICTLGARINHAVMIYCLALAGRIHGNYTIAPEMQGSWHQEVTSVRKKNWHHPQNFWTHTLICGTSTFNPYLLLVRSSELLGVQ